MTALILIRLFKITGEFFHKNTISLKFTELNLGNFYSFDKCHLHDIAMLRIVIAAVILLPLIGETHDVHTIVLVPWCGYWLCHLDYQGD